MDSSDRPAVLLLHGLTGTPLDVRPLAEAFGAQGYAVSAPLLPGRGTCAADMHGLCWEDWMSFAVSAFDELAVRHGEVILGGLSAGGTMALDLALRRKPAALLLYSAAVGISNRLAYLAPYVWRVVRQWPSPGSDFVDPSMAVSFYNPAPVRAVAELIFGISRVRPRLGRIECPALVAHSVSDRFVPIGAARDLAARLGGPVRTLFLEGTGHAITVDARRHDVADASLAFVRQMLEPARLRSA